MIVREAVPDDLNRGLWELVNTFGETDTSSIPHNERQVLYERANANAKVFVCVNEKRQVVGTAKLLIECKLHHGGAAVGHLEDVVVHEEWRRRGIGRLLVRRVMEEASRPENNIYKVILECSDDLARFYTNSGFRRLGCEMGVYL